MSQFGAEAHFQLLCDMHNLCLNEGGLLFGAWKVTIFVAAICPTADDPLLGCKLIGAIYKEVQSSSSTGFCAVDRGLGAWLRPPDQKVDGGSMWEYTDGNVELWKW